MSRGQAGIVLAVTVIMALPLLLVLSMGYAGKPGVMISPVIFVAAASLVIASLYRLIRPRQR